MRTEAIERIPREVELAHHELDKLILAEDAVLVDISISKHLLDGSVGIIEGVGCLHLDPEGLLHPVHSRGVH